MKPRTRGHRRRIHIEREVELNIIAFMNLMVVLVPFLLTTAVFSRLSVLAIDVPAPGSQAAAPPPPPAEQPLPFTLTVRLEEAGIAIAAGTLAPELLPRTPDGGYDTAELRTRLAAIKREHPEHDAVNLLSRPDTPYAELIAIMDAARVDQEGRPLFADLRLGEFHP